MSSDANIFKEKCSAMVFKKKWIRFEFRGNDIYHACADLIFEIIGYIIICLDNRAAAIDTVIAYVEWLKIN